MDWVRAQTQVSIEDKLMAPDVNIKALAQQARKALLAKGQNHCIGYLRIRVIPVRRLRSIVF
ncbi:hypothetical protein [Ketobacter sp.]|nr:MAG: hypothetical protein D6160_00195 [Ketobacter sp.]